jgi:hypothetical protein
MNMKREISIDDDPQGSREAVFKSSGDAGQRGSRRYYTLLESALWVFALGGGCVPLSLAFVSSVTRKNARFALMKHLDSASHRFFV